MFSILIFLIGLILIYLTLQIESKKCPPPKIEYRFIPRTFTEEQESPIKASEIFKSMFEKPTPFLGRALGRDTTKSDINRNFISQG